MTIAKEVLLAGQSPPFAIEDLSNPSGHLTRMGYYLPSEIWRFCNSF